MALQAKSAHGSQLYQTSTLFAALHQVPACSKLRLSSGKFRHLCAARGMVYSASEYLPKHAVEARINTRARLRMLHKAQGHCQTGVFADAEGRSWMAMRISSGSVRTPSLALS